MASIICIKKSAFILIFPFENNLPLNSSFLKNIFCLSLIFSNVLSASLFLWIYTAWNFVFLFILECILKNRSKYFYKLMFPTFIFVLDHFTLFHMSLVPFLCFPSFNNFFLYFTWLFFLNSFSSLILFSPVFSLLFMLYFTVICIMLVNLRMTIWFTFIDSSYLI